MKRAGTGAEKRGLGRALVRRGARSDRSPILASKWQPLDYTVCDGCGAVFQGKTWRRSPHRLAQAFLGSLLWGVCPRCGQAGDRSCFARVVLRKAVETPQQDAIREHVERVVDHAVSIHAEGRVVAVGQAGPNLQVVTGSQELAHRIVEGLKRVLGARASYTWPGGEARLVATLDPDDGRRGWSRRDPIRLV